MLSDRYDPWSPDHGWRWISEHATALASLEGDDVARAFVLSALLAEMAGLLALAVSASQTAGVRARREAWQAVAALVPNVRDAIAPAGSAVVELARPVRRSTALVDHLAELAVAAPPAASMLRQSSLPPLPPPDGSPATLRRWYLDSGPQPALDLLSAAATALPGLAADCDAWAADLDAAFRALDV